MKRDFSDYLITATVTCLVAMSCSCMLHLTVRIWRSILCE